MDMSWLEKEGFTKRGVFEDPRLSEIVEMYKEAGFDVVVVDYENTDPDSCKQCYEGKEMKKRYKVVYTKKIGG